MKITEFQNLGKIKTIKSIPGPWLVRFFSLGIIRMNQILMSKVNSDQEYAKSLNMKNYTNIW